VGAGAVVALRFKNVQRLMDEEAALRAKGKGQRNDQQIMAASLEKKELANANVKNLDWKLMPRDVLVNGKRGLHRRAVECASEPQPLARGSSHSFAATVVRVFLRNPSAGEIRTAVDRTLHRREN
jgi:hypothetical protein